MGIFFLAHPLLMRYLLFEFIFGGMSARVYVGALIFLVGACLLGLSSWEGHSIETSLKRDELPRDVEPIHYQIVIEPSWANFTFTGSEVVEIAIHESTSTIVLHANQLTIHGVYLFYPSPLVPLVIQPENVQVDTESKRLTIEFTEPLQTGKASLYVEFEGSISDQMDGLYRSSFRSVDAELDPESIYLLSTQMEPVGARRVFPCWDEPSRKATFQLTVRIPHHLVALSNTPVQSTTQFNDKLKVRN